MPLFFFLLTHLEFYSTVLLCFNILEYLFSQDWHNTCKRKKGNVNFFPISVTLLKLNSKINIKNYCKQGQYILYVYSLLLWALNKKIGKNARSEFKTWDCDEIFYKRDLIIHLAKECEKVLKRNNDLGLLLEIVTKDQDNGWFKTVISRDCVQKLHDARSWLKIFTKDC